jgi:hypothetical protein
VLLAVVAGRIKTGSMQFLFPGYAKRMLCRASLYFICLYYFIYLINSMGSGSFSVAAPFFSFNLLFA